MVAVVRGQTLVTAGHASARATRGGGATAQSPFAPASGHQGGAPGSRSFQNNLSSLRGAGEERAHESSRACPLFFPPPRPRLREKSGRREEASWAGAVRKRSSPQNLAEKNQKHLENASHRVEGKARPIPGCAESRPARTPTTLGDSPAPRSRVRKWKGKHGSVPGRRGHHVQLPTTPSPLRGSPPPRLVFAGVKHRHPDTGEKTSLPRQPPPGHYPNERWSRSIPETAPNPKNLPSGNETRNKNNSKRAFQAE